MLFAQDSTEAGELLLSLCYLPAVERLTVTVIKARNLKPMDISGTSGTLRIHYEFQIHILVHVSSSVSLYVLASYEYSCLVCRLQTRT